MAAPSANMKAVVLNSWKEIASYLGRGVRTVQRYERELGLPVRRPHGRSRSAVIALRDELDAWLCAAPKRELEPKVVERSDVQLHNTKNAITASSKLRERCHELRDANHAAIASLMERVRETMQCVSPGKEQPFARVRAEAIQLQDEQLTPVSSWRKKQLASANAWVADKKVA